MIITQGGIGKGIEIRCGGIGVSIRADVRAHVLGHDPKDVWLGLGWAAYIDHHMVDIGTS